MQGIASDNQKSNTHDCPDEFPMERLGSKAQGLCWSAGSTHPCWMFMFAQCWVGIRSPSVLLHLEPLTFGLTQKPLDTRVSKSRTTDPPRLNPTLSADLSLVPAYGLKFRTAPQSFCYKLSGHCNGYRPI